MLYGDFLEKNRCTGNDRDDVLRVELEYSSSVLRLLVEFCFTDRLDSLEGGVNDTRDTVNNNSNSSGSSNAAGEDDGSSNDSRVTDDNEKKESHCQDGKGGSAGNNNSTSSLSRTARLLTSLSAAAHYFDIPKLEHDILSRLNDIMAHHPSFSCVVLDEASKIMQEELCQVAMERIRARPKAALLPYDGGCGVVSANNVLHETAIQDKGGVVALSASLLERVVFDEKSNASELTKFTCLTAWVEGCRHEIANDVEANIKREVPSDEDEDETTCRYDATDASSSPAKSCESRTDNKSHRERKQSIAAHLATKLDLSLIPASDLDTVSRSNLLSKDDLFRAYRLQALNAERTKSKVFVEGAGISEINGTYIQGGVHEGIPMYNKEGVWRDREEVFRIFLCTYSNGNKSWCISIVPKGKEPGKTTDVDFYECPVTYGSKGGVGPYAGVSENGLGVVPSRGMSSQFLTTSFIAMHDENLTQSLSLTLSIRMEISEFWSASYT